MKRRILIILTALTLAFIWGNSALSYRTSNHVSEAVTESIVRPAQQAAAGEEAARRVTQIQVRKWAHAVEYAALGALLGALLIEKKAARGVLFACNAALFAGFIDETIQLLRGRNDSVADVWLDLAGAAAGVAAVWLLRVLFAGKKHG